MSRWTSCAREAGFFGPEAEFAAASSRPVDTYKIIVKEIDVIGEISQIPYDWHTAIYLAGTGRVQLKPLVTHQYDLDRWEEALTWRRRAECLRVAIKP